MIDSFFGFKLNTDCVSVITVYECPTDFECKFVARLLECRYKEVKPTKYYVIGDTLDEVRKKIPSYGARFERSEFDDKCIVETWII